MSTERETPPRGWVVRLGAYLRIFGTPAPGTLGWRTAPEQLDGLVRLAQEREQEFSALPAVLRESEQ